MFCRASKLDVMMFISYVVIGKCERLRKKCYMKAIKTTTKMSMTDCEITKVCGFYQLNATNKYIRKARIG